MNGSEVGRVYRAEAMAASNPPTPADPREHLAILWQRKWWIIICLVLVLAATLAYSLTRTALYRATAEVVISGTPNANGTVTRPESVDADVYLAGSDPVRTATREEVGPEPGLTVTGDDATASLSFTATSTSARDAATAADAFARAFVEERQRQRLIEYDATSAVLEAQLTDVEAQIDELNRQEGEAILAASDDQARVAIQQQFREQRQPLEDTRTRYRALLDDLNLSVSLAEGAGARVLNPARAPSRPFSPDTPRNLALAGALGLLIGVGVAYVAHYLDTKLKTEDDLEAVTGLPTLTVVPAYGERKRLGRSIAPSTGRAGIITLAKPRSEVSEAFRRLRTSVQFLSSDRPMGILQVTSPSIGDGKSTTASNLAVTAARAGQRVVLVDLDLRRPRQQENFETNNDVGVTSVIDGSISLSDAVRRIADLPNLVVLPSGPVPQNPAELLASPSLRRLLDALRASADLVVVDSPPVLAVSDPLILAGVVDAVLLVASAGRTDKRQVGRALGQLKQVDAPLIGTVLNRFEPPKIPGYGYGYGYGDGYGYGYGGGSRSAYTSEAPGGPSKAVS